LARALLARLAGAVGVAAAGGALATGALTSPATQHRLAEGGPACPFRWATGLPCPFCGMTHATIALGGGHVRDALHFHPLAPVVLALFVWASVLLVLDKPSRVSAGTILLVTAAIWVVRLSVFWAA
jgi:hypothetical protein